jgi:hypothetical protein
MWNMTKNMFGTKKDDMKAMSKIAPFQGFARFQVVLIGLYPMLLILPFQGFASYFTFFHRALPNANDIATLWL